MRLRLYNTLTRSLQLFEPTDAKKHAVSMYVCGPTVYDDPHIGHLRSAYVFDVLCRYMEWRGFQVKFVRNVTDVDDKIIDKANQALGASGAEELTSKCREISEQYLKSYRDTLKILFGYFATFGS